MISSVSQKQQSKNLIDVLKLFMAVCVIAIHTHPFANIPLSRPAQAVYDTVVSLAVPFFFLTSGYFLGKKLQYPVPGEDDFSIVFASLKKTFRLYLLWTIVYFPLALGHAVISKTHPLKFVVMYIRGVLIIGQNYNSWILWYLLSMIYALVLILILIKLKLSWKQLVCIGCLFIPVNIVFDLLHNYSGELPAALNIFKKFLRYSVEDGRILRGLFFIPLGILLAHKKPSPAFCWILFLSCFAADCAIANAPCSIILLVFASVGLFSIAESTFLPPSRIYVSLRKTSTVFYFTHLYVWTVYYTLVYGNKTYGLDCFMVTTLCCAFLSWLYLIVRSRRRAGSIAGR